MFPKYILYYFEEKVKGDSVKSVQFGRKERGYSNLWE